ncbi:bifunctional folylpolyglutamate synthase/dihydrofolate synthase [Clostridium massiliamazoniense]|uniref:bifunctional folylpolyglutamate synthase/dihydrofolate synthase n=1 Tax=Clostridium massiliamazoniense TaxID=1347366 RepID=UPI0006D7BA26|nr:folylpolyglutamate synthase/dihydrofolate synthase family protein [Clostridium massiliamazoniense]
MNYSEAMNFIANTSRFGMNFGLSRVEKMLELLGNPQNKIKCIHIAGTNGKGSTTAMIASILKEEGYTVGMYTSPYLEEFEERIQINGVNIPKERLAELVSKIQKVSEEIVTLGFDNPTQFEIITAIMFLYFSEENVDYAIIEVGLGGRLDATNVIDPVLVVITSISYDHMNILGETIEEIAGEKCGIIKNSPVVTYPQVEEAMKVIEEKCKEKSVQLIKTSESSIKEVIINKNDNIQNIKLEVGSELKEYKLALIGKHQVKNAMVVLNVIEAFKTLGGSVKEESIKAGLENVRWIGRMERLNKNPMVVIDGAHNIDGIRTLKESVKEYFSYNKLILILGILGDKQVKEMVNTIGSLGEDIILTEPHNERAESLEVMESYLKEENKNVYKIMNYREAYEKALDLANEDDLILICGSLYMVGDMRKEITRKLFNI